MSVEENGEITKKHLKKSVSPLTFLLLNLESEAQQTNQWQGVYFLTLKDKQWPWGQQQKDNEIHEPMIGMGAVRLNNKITKGTMNVDSYFKFEKSGSHLQFNACYKKGQQEVRAGSTTMLTHQTWLEWHQSHSDKINRCEPGHFLEQMEQGKIGITIQLTDMNGIAAKHAIIPATHELMTRYCPETVGIYQYHVGLADAPTEIHEELEVSPEEDEREETERPYQSFGYRIMNAIQEIHRTRRGQLTRQTDYLQLMLQSSRLPTVMRPIVFTFEVDKLEKLADTLFKIMVYDQCTKIEDFAEGGKVDQICTHIWLNAICVPIARTLTWLLADVVTDAEDAYQIKVTDANGDDKHTWKGLNTARAGEVAYWVNQLDQTILHKEAVFHRINNDAEAIDREHRRVASTTPGTHTTTTWTWGGAARAARSTVNSDTTAEKRATKPLHVSPHEISVKIPIAHAQAAIVKLQMLAPMIQDRRLTLWTNAEENVGASQKSRHRETCLLYTSPSPRDRG